MAFGLGCFAGKVTYNTKIWISDILGLLVNMDSPKTSMDGEYPVWFVKLKRSFCNSFDF